MLIEYLPDNTKFRFGDGPVYLSKKIAVIPIQLGSQKFKLHTSVVECDVPLLISRPTLARADAYIGFRQDELWIGNERIDVIETKSGHLCVPITNRSVKQSVKQVLFSCPLQKDDKSNVSKISKLHKQFAHPTPEKLIDLIRNSGIVDKKIEDTVKEISKNCDICARYKRPPLRPVVAMPLASEFNEVVAMDLKFIDQVPVLHMICHATRYSMSVHLRNKKAITIVEGAMNYWIRIFGAPSKYFLSDNGGEFVNNELRELADKFNFRIETTAAESCWSNGLVERHHCMIEDNVRKVKAETGCPLELAIPWANSAKNALANVYGYSSNQLVFGRNINVPSVHHDKLPAQNESCCSKWIAKHLMALHKTRQAFITQESCEKLRRALNRQTRNFSDIVYQTHDRVYYKKNDSKEWHGPGKVIGCEKSQYLIKDGGGYTRVHPCRMKLAILSDSHGMPGNVLVDKCDDRTVDVDKCDARNVIVDKCDAKSVDVNDKCDDKNDVGRKAVENVNYESDDEVPKVPKLRALLTPPVTPAHHDQQNLDQNNDIPHLDLDQSDILLHDHESSEIVNEPSVPHDNDSDNNDTPLFNESPPKRQSKQAESTMTSRPPQAPPESIKPCRALARLYDYNNPGERDVASVPKPRNQVTTDESQATAIQSQPTADSSEEEIYFGKSTNSARYDIAKEEELNKWKEFEAYEEVPDIGQPKISTRWVCTEKMKGGVLQLKARLVARGFEEDKAQFRTDSPTCYKDSLRLLLTVLSSKNWQMKSMDVKRAYLQGNKIQREIFLKPPKEAKTDKLWRLIQTPDGIADAGRQWYIRIQKEFTSLGAKKVGCDRAVFVWNNPDGVGTCGVILAHVDDFLYGGNEYFQTNIIPKIKEIFKISLEEENKFRYLGLYVEQSSHGISISLENYIRGMDEMDTSRLGKDKSRLLNNQEKTELKQVIGQINWAATQSRPDVSFENCILGGLADKSTVAEVYEANKIVRKLKGQTLNLFFSSMFDLKSVRIVAFGDSSFANLHDYGSQGGLLIFVVDKNGLYNLIAWQSKRIKRVVNASLSAECLEAVEAAETAILIRNKLEDMLSMEHDSIPISVLCDNKGLVDAVHKTTSIQNKALQIDINMLREMVERNVICEFRWIDAKHQLADTLTKRGASTDKLKWVLMNTSGRYDHDTATFY